MVLLMVGESGRKLINYVLLTFVLRPSALGQCSTKLKLPLFSVFYTLEVIQNMLFSLNLLLPMEPEVVVA